MGFKCTMYINWSGDQVNENVPAPAAGWSENWFSAYTLFSNIQPAFRDLCNRRAALLSKSCAVVAQRYQRVDPVGPAQLTTEVYPGGSGLAQDAPGMSLSFRVGTQVGNRSRVVALRGTPDSRVVGGVYAPSLAYTTALTNFFAGVASFGMRVIDPGAPSAPIFSITTDGHFDLAGDLALSIGDIVTVTRATNEDGNVVSGNFRVQTVPSGFTSGLLAGWDGGRVRESGRMQLRTRTIALLSTLTNIAPAVVLRKVGRPFGQPRGRASKRKRRQVA